MTVAFLAQASAIVALACAAVLVCFLFGGIYLIALHLGLRRNGLAREAALLALPQPADNMLPHVVVQITVCNEGRVVTRAIETVLQLDWPRDKLHIQICDDSSDDTTEIARAAIAANAQSGIDIQLLRRTDRSDFKAGNLRAAMAESTHDYFAIFDVDYVVPPDFLRKCMPILIADPGLSFVQARPDFLNANENAVTRAAALHLDAHHAIEQATRYWAGHPLQFNGTCGIWRRAAIESCGGWSGATMLEDVDLGYRAAFNGWRAVFLTSVFAQGDLPSTPRVWILQQRRWSVGLCQNARMHIPHLFTVRNLPLSSRLGGLLHLGTIWWIPPVGTTMFVASVIAVVLEPQWLALLLSVQLGLLVAGQMQQFFHLRIGQRFVRGSVPLSRFMADLLALSLLIARKEITNIGGMRRKQVFRRTPTTGQESRLRSSDAVVPAIAPGERA